MFTFQREILFDFFSWIYREQGVFIFVVSRRYMQDPVKHVF